jgi:hypothetical protein
MRSLPSLAKSECRDQRSWKEPEVSHLEKPPLQLNADAATCGDGRRTFARGAVTVVAWIREDAADSPASS